MVKKKCIKGWDCGNSCISRTKKCRSNLGNDGKKIVESFLKYLQRTQEPGEEQGPRVPTVLFAKEGELSKFNSIAQEVIEPPPIKPLTQEEEELILGENSLTRSAQGYDNVIAKAERILEANPEITEAEAQALAQYIHHTFYPDMNRVLYMNNLEVDEEGNSNIELAKDQYGQYVAPMLGRVDFKEPSSGVKTYSKEGIDTLKALDKAVNNATRKLDKATTEKLSERYRIGHKFSEEFRQWDGSYKRFVDFDSPEAKEGFLKQYQESKGEELIHPALTSTTWRDSHSFFDKPDSVVLKILPKEEGSQGVMVDRFKNIADEAEVLYPPGQKFRVVEIGKTGVKQVTFQKAAEALDLEGFSNDLALNVQNASFEDLENSKFLTEFKKELSTIDPEDIPFLAPEMLKIMSMVEDLEMPSLDDIGKSEEWLKVLPDESLFSLMLKGEFGFPDSLKGTPGRTQVVLQEV